MGDFKKPRRVMIERHLKGRGISDPLVLAAMEAVPREAFIPEDLKKAAYADRPLPIGEGQTISQPYIVALMTEVLALEGGEKVLEVGAGSGYAAAVLAEIAGRVFTIERHRALADHARQKLKPWKNVKVIAGDGSKGLPEEAPFDAIVVTAAGPSVPAALKRQLKIGGRLVIPVGPKGFHQTLVKIMRKDEDIFSEKTICPVAFVPLIGEEGF